MLEINVSPFATNVLDLVGDENLVTQDGKPVAISRSGVTFVVHVDNKHVYENDDNLAVSYFLNGLPLCKESPPSRSMMLDYLHKKRG